jgi:alkaline phosphatase
MRKILILTLIVPFIGIFFGGCESEIKQEKEIKYVFYFIGDGMGLAQSHAAELFLAAKDKSNNFPFLNMNRLPYHTYFTTHAKNRYITGSAAAGTAMSSGEKTTISTIGKNGDRTQNLNPVSAKAKTNGMKIGIITSVSLDHATPASFYAHQDTRDMYYEIGLDLVKSEFDFLGGGGFRYPNGKNNDADTNIIEYAKSSGYQYINSKSDFQLLHDKTQKHIVVNKNLDAGAAIPYRLDQDETDITLKDLLTKAIELLDNEKGFFVMIEGGKIDWAAHENDAASVIHDVIAMDEAVGVAMEFYNKYPDETIILVGADHETGGMALGNTLSHYETDYDLFDYQKSSMNVLIKEFEEIEKLDYKKAMEFIRNELSLNDTVTRLKLTDYDIKSLKKAYKAYITPKSSFDENEYYDLYSAYNPFIVEALRIFYFKIGVSFTTWSHTGIPVPLRYIGIEPETFYGLTDNTQLPKIIEKELKLNQ